MKKNEKLLDVVMIVLTIAVTVLLVVDATQVTLPPKVEPDSILVQGSN